MNKYIILSDYPEDTSFKYFFTLEDAKNYVKNTLIKQAELQAYEENEGYTPAWVDDILILKIIGDVVEEPEGLVLRMLEKENG